MSSNVEKIDDEEEELSLKEKLKKDFDAIDQSFNNNLGSTNEFEKSSIELDRKNYDEKTDEEILELAKSSLKDYYNSGVENLKNSNKTEVENLSKKTVDMQNAASKSKQVLDQEIDIAKDSAKNQAIKRGLARSSIIMEQLEDYDDKKISETAKIESDLNNSIAEINYEIQGLEGRLEDSLKSFDLSYASKLQEKISKLKEEQTQKIEEVLEYNNSQKLKEAEYNSKQNELYAKYADSAFEKNLDLSDYIAKNGDGEIKRAINQQKYNIASAYFNTLSKAEAIDELINKDYDYYIDSLGAYFYKLYSELKKRTN